MRSLSNLYHLSLSWNNEKAKGTPKPREQNRIIAERESDCKTERKMSCPFENERIETMAISFEEQLSIVYPKVPSMFRDNSTTANDSDGKSGCDETKEDSLFRGSLMNVIDELPFAGDVEEFHKAMTMVAHKWRSEKDKNRATAKVGEASTATKKSFSLLDQLQGGFAMPVSLEEIEEAASSQQRLQVFQKIKYLEDLFMDWNKICPLLLDDLSTSFLGDATLCLQLIDLHRKWFDQGRSSSEYTSLLYGICENMLRTLANIVSMEETVPIEDASQINQKTIVIALVQNWRDMWLDLMQRDQYSEDLAGGMEKRVLALFWGPASNSALLLAKRVIASLDPSATWFQSWTNHVSTNEYLISLMQGSQSDAKVLSELWTQVKAHQNKMGDTLFPLHCTAILSIMLCRIRVPRFPWDALTESNTDEDTESTKENKDNTNAFRTAIDETLDLFLHTIGVLAIDDEFSKADVTITTILNGVEAILAGSQSNIEVDRRYKKIESVLLGEENVARNVIVGQFLRTQLKR